MFNKQKKKSGRKAGGKNKPGHKAGRPFSKKILSSQDTLIQSTLNLGTAGPSTFIESRHTQQVVTTEVEKENEGDASDNGEDAPREMVDIPSEERDTPNDERSTSEAFEDCNDSLPNEAAYENTDRTASHLDNFLTTERHFCPANLQEEAYGNLDDEDNDVFMDANDHLVPGSDGIDIDNQQEEDLANIKDDSIISKYLRQLQEDLSARPRGSLPENYKMNTFWINPPNPSLLFRSKQLKASPLYYPRVFLWLPLHLLPPGQQPLCPKCKTRLTNNNWYKDPCARRIIDLEDCFYLMTNRLICQEGHTIAGTEPDIVEQLSGYMQAEFPAVLTASSGISKVYAKLMRILVQNSVGPTRQHRLLREMHMLRYDELEYKYLSANVIAHRGKAAYTNNPPNVEEFSTFNDKSKYAGTVSSSGYLRYVYTSLISKIRPALDKQMTLLDGTILAGDHSFKILDHLGKINSSSVFGALYTVLNEYEEVMVMLLTPTKAVTHLYQSFTSLYNRYTTNGFKLPALYYTDNPKQDRRFLEETLPSLLLNVKAKEDGATTYEEPVDENLVAMDVPDDVNVDVLSSVRGIQDACDLIIRNTRDESGQPSKHVYIGFDCEWPVSMQKGKKRNKVALIQIAFDKNIYLIQVSKLGRSLPSSLFTLLESDLVVKLGVRVATDLQYVMQDYPKSMDSNNKPIFGKPMGAFDIGPFCKNRGFSDRLNPSLSTLCKNVLALDAYVALAIFEKLKNKEAANVKLIDTRPGMCVSLFSGSRESACALGTLREPNDTEKAILATTKKKLAIVEVAKVLTPSLILRHHKLLNGDLVALADLGSPPFRIVFNIDELKTALPSDLYEESDAPSGSTSVPETIAPLEDIPVESSIEELLEDEVGDIDAVDIDEPAGVFFESSERIDDAVPEHYSRVKKDIFHLMEMIPISLRHGMSKQFKRAFRDALFMVDKSDKAAVYQAFIKMDKDHTEEEKNEYWSQDNLQKKWDEYVLCKSEWLWKRVRRYVPGPEELEPVVKELFKQYADVKCSKTGNKLFDKQARVAAKHVLKSIRLGYVSDPKGIPLYYKVGTGSYDLPIYRCVRGSNDVEGGIHMNIVRKFGSYNASPDLADCALADYRLRHNTDNGSLNRFGKVHKGHYNPWLTQVIDNWRIELGHPSYFSYHTAFGNPQDFQESPSDLKESFGIAPVTAEMRNELSMIQYIDTISSKKTRPVGDHLPIKVYRMYSNQFEHLAKVQNVMYALIPVITPQEIKTYDDILRTHTQFVSPRNNAAWVDFAKLWNEQEANGKDIFYKTGDHLKSYSNILRDRATYYNTLMNNLEIVNSVRHLIQSRSTPVVEDAVELPVIEDRRDQVPEIHHVRQEEQPSNSNEGRAVISTTHQMPITQQMPTQQMPTQQMPTQQMPPLTNWQGYTTPHPYPYFAQGAYYLPTTSPAPSVPTFGPPPPWFFSNQASTYHYGSYRGSPGPSSAPERPPEPKNFIFKTDHPDKKKRKRF